MSVKSYWDFFHGRLPMEDIWEREGPFRKNVQCDYKNFLSNSIKVNLINLLHLEPTGNCSVSSPEARSATWHASLHWGETPGQGEGFGRHPRLFNWGNEVQSWWNHPRWQNSCCASPFKLKEAPFLGCFFNKFAAQVSLASNNLSDKQKKTLTFPTIHLHKPSAFARLYSRCIVTFMT